MAICNNKKCSLGECDQPETCAAYVPVLTRADKIRAMSDEELAAMLKDYKDCNKNCIISNGKNCYQICEEESTLLKWLQQPAEEVDHAQK